MKNLFKPSVAGVAFAFGLAAMQLSCSSDTKTTTTQATVTNSAENESEAAYTDYKNYVSTLDTSATALRDTASARWKDERSMYDAKVAQIDQYATDYDENRRQEIDQLKSRYNNYWNNFGTTRSGGITPKGVATPPAMNSGQIAVSGFNTATITATTPLAIRQAYESFVTKVQAEKESFTKDDWKKVENYYQALDDRKNEMQSQLSDKDKYEIGKAKAKYVALKTGEKVDPDLSKAADDVKQTGKKAGDKIETAADKVGHAAKETGKDVKNATVKGAKAVGNTAEKAGQKVEDVFDGKKEKE